MRLLIVAAVLFVSCGIFKNLQKNIQSVDDEIIIAIMDEMQKNFEEIAKDSEKRAFDEAIHMEEFGKNNENKVIRKSAERLDPIIKKAMEKIEPAVKEAVKEIKDQVREEILEELTGKEINRAIK